MAEADSSSVNVESAGTSAEARPSSNAAEHGSSDHVSASTGGERPAQTSTDAKSPDTARSSGADDTGATKERETLLSVVRKVTRSDDAQSGQSPKPKDGNSSQVQGERTDGEHAEAETPEDAAEDEKSVPFHQHPRWQKVVGERNALRAQVTAIQKEAVSWKRDSDDYRKVTGFMEHNGLSGAEVGEGFEIMSLLKNNPAKALERLAPVVDNLRRFVGDLLPDDLRQKVDQGYLDEATARETARLRAQQNYNAQLTADRNARAQQQRQMQEQQAYHNRLANEFSATVGTWETEIRGKDPDFDRKAVIVKDYAEKLLREQGWPRTKEEALDVVKRAYAVANQRLKFALPLRSSITPSPRSSNSSTNGQTAPKTMLEVVRRARRGELIQ